MLTFRLIHAGGFWIAENGDVRVEAGTLPELDRELGLALGKTRKDGALDKIDVRMTFDNSVLPKWMRQYSNHYFNRVVTLNLV